MNILHTEASTGWGGQEIRILAEAEGMRLRGHSIILAVQKGAHLASRARQAGFPVYEVLFSKANIFYLLWQLRKIIRKHNISLLNTHSSKDAWLGGFAGRLAGIKVMRTRHLSTPIRSGWNSKLLYSWLADYTVTTCAVVAENIKQQANISAQRCSSIPTGVNPTTLQVSEEAIQTFKTQWHLQPTDCIIGTACVLRSWKGIKEFLQAAKILQHHQHLKWVIVGNDPYGFKELSRKMGLENVIFTNHLDNPFPALASFDIFTLLSTANEGVSQASLQAAYLAKPLITTSIGGLPEVCIDGCTGYLVPEKNPEAFAQKVLELSQTPQMRVRMGSSARQLVEEKFTHQIMLDTLEKIYQQFC